MTAVRVATEERYLLAEGPFWDVTQQRLLWVDIEQGLVLVGLLRSDGQIDVVDRVSFSGRVGAVAPAADGSWIVALDRELIRRDAGGELSPGPEIVPTDSGRRLNDGKPDPRGRYLIGSLSLDGQSTSEVLVVVDETTVGVLDDDLTLSNGLAWSVDGQTLYSVDSEARVIFRRSWDPGTGVAGARVEHIHIAGDGLPDGMTIDTDNHLWVAVWGAGEIRQYSPQGDLVGTIHLPVPHPSSVAFAGAELRTLVITTARTQLEDSGRAQYPDAGRLFTCEPGATGVAQPLWSGRLPGLSEGEL